MKGDAKPLLPHPIYLPLAVVVFALLVGIGAFGILQTGLSLGDDFLWITVFGAVLFSVAFTVFIRGGWRKEHEDKMRELNG